MTYRNVAQTVSSFTELMTVREIYRIHAANKFFYDRERLQRLLIPWIQWKKNSYITSLMNGGNLKDLFQIAKIEPIVRYLQSELNPAIHNYEYVKENLEYFTDLHNQGYEYLVLDGQHRIDTIARYVENNIDFDPTTAIELKNDEDAGSIYVKGKWEKTVDAAQKFFLDQQVIVTTYTTGDLRELARIFITSNDMEPMTAHEKRILNYNPLNRWLTKLCLHDINLRKMFDTIGGMTGEYDLDHKGDTLFVAEMLRYINFNEYDGYNHADIDTILGAQTSSKKVINIGENEKKLTAQIFRLMADGCALYDEKKLKKFSKGSIYNLFYTCSFLMQKNNKWGKQIGLDGNYRIADAYAFVKWFFDKEFERMNAPGTYSYLPVQGKKKPKKQVNDWSFRKHNNDQKHRGKESVTGEGGSKYTFTDWARVRYILADLNEDLKDLENRGIIQKVGERSGDITRDEALVAARIPLSEAHKYHVDEIVPVSKGGFRNKDNVQVLTADKNLIKGSRSVA